MLKSQTGTGSEYRVVGTNPRRHDGVDKVTGRAKYGADVHLPGMLTGMILRSPHTHAVIRRIDTSRAASLPGVKAVVTSAMLPKIAGVAADVEGLINFRFASNNCLASDKVLYKGHAVAAVAAVSPEIAEQALSLIQVDYEVLPHVLDGREAIKPGAPILHPQLKKANHSELRPGAYRPPGEEGEPTNIASHFVHQVGDVEQAFRDADVVVEHETHSVQVHQGYIEPQSATAHWEPTGYITIWSATQGQFMVRELTARLLGIPSSRIRAIPMEIGGGFGGKTIVYLEPVAALLSRESGGHPVKITMTRTEVFEATGPTSGTHIKIRFGATRDGKLVAGDAHLIYEAGAFPGSPVIAATRLVFAPYDIPNMRSEGIDVVVNRPKSNAYRAPGATQAYFASETAIDELCLKLGMDPVEFRLRNAAKEGTRQVHGPPMGKIGLVETLQAIRGSEHYQSSLSGPYRGRGVATGFWGNASGPSNAIAVVNPDGTVSLNEGSVDIGGTRTSVAMQFAEVLGIPVEHVKPSVADTDSIGYTSNTGGSSVTFKTGWAAYEAAQDVKRQVIARAARIWNVKPEDIEYVDATVRHKSDPNLKFTFQQVAERMNRTGGSIVGRGSVEPRGVGGGFGVHVADVEVDPETGKVTILRYTAAQDVGKAIYPPYVEGQIEGGVAQGVGWALNEEYVVNDQGRMVNPSFLDYRMPTALDLPMIDTILVEVPNPGHPFGARGVGEVPICPPVAAICNAIRQATGIRMTTLPMSPPRLLAAIQAGGRKGKGSANGRKNGRR